MDISVAGPFSQLATQIDMMEFSVDMPEKCLIFVYNADGGTLNAMMDSAHKLFAPATYQCSLCAITHNMLTMRREWKDYMRSLSYKALFYHRDDFCQQWPNQRTDLPAIFIQEENGSLQNLISADELNQQTNVAQLIAIIEHKLATHR
jgi:hypothetical protein